MIHEPCKEIVTSLFELVPSNPVSQRQIGVVFVEPRIVRFIFFHRLLPSVRW
jgi:hypothetical protein